MSRAIRNLTFVAVLAAGALLAPGCEKNDCALTPDLSTAPGNCTFPASETVTVNVRWCSCSSDISCTVTNEGSGFYQAEPKVTSCDATCDNSGSCGTQLVPCTFDVPGSGDYHLVVRGGQRDQDIPFSIGMGSTTCSP